MSRRADRPHRRRCRLDRTTPRVPAPKPTSASAAPTSDGSGVGRRDNSTEPLLGCPANIAPKRVVTAVYCPAERLIVELPKLLSVPLKTTVPKELTILPVS